MAKRNYGSIILCLLVLVVWIFPAEAVADGIKFSIRSIKTSYLLAEPVFIDLTLKNESSTETVRVSSELEVEKEIVSVFIASGDGPFHQYHPGFVIEPSRPPRGLGPLETIVHRQLLLYNNSTKNYAFPAAGVYRIRAVYHRFGAAPDVESNTIEVRVSEPTGTDAKALQLFRTKKVADLIMNVGEDSEAVKHLELLMMQYPFTTYGKYAQFYLARRQTREFFSRKPNYERAVKLYRDLIQRDPAFPLITEANYRLGVALHKTGKYEDAKRRFNFVLKESRETREVEGARRFLERIRVIELKKGKK